MIHMLMHACTSQESSTEEDEKIKTFSLLEQNQNDNQLMIILQEACLNMLSNTLVALQFQGIEIGALLTDFKKDSDPIFAQIMKLLCTSKSPEVRKKIIKAIKAPYSIGALAFLGKRLKDQNPDVCVLVFKQMIANKTDITAFASKETRMLVITEGITSPH